MAGTVALALIAGGGIVLAMNWPGEGDKTAGSGSPEVSPEENLQPEIGGALPKEFLGTWQSAPKNSEGKGAVMHQVEIHQGGRPNDIVAVTHSVHTDTSCETLANLDSYKDGVMRVINGPSNPFAEGETCPQYKYKRQEFVYRNKALMWSGPGTNATTRLHRVGGIREKSVPKAMIGEWKMTGESAGGNEGTVDFEQGESGRALMVFNGTGRSEGCSWMKGLAAADDSNLVFAGLGGGNAGCDNWAGDPAAPMRVTMNGDDEVRLNSLVEPGSKPVILQRAD